MTYEVKLEQFEGPLDLLLSLISRHEVDIYSISVSEITEEYLTYINSLKDLNLEVASEFLLIAATLLEIKSRGLLPGDKAEIEPIPAETVRKELIKKLITYKKFKNAADFMKQSFELGSKYYKRIAELEEPFVKLMPDFDQEISSKELAMHLLHLIRVRHYTQVSLGHITPMPLSVEDQVKYVLEKLEDKPQKFKELTQGFGRHEIIVTFLASLELYKRLLIDIKQAINFGEIELELLEEAKIN